MAAKGQSLAEKLSRWELLVTNSKLDPQPHLAADLASLEALLTQGRAIESRQEALRSQARALNTELRKIGAQGEKLRARLGASMQGMLGFDSNELVKFGFKPRKPPVRKRKPAPEPETPAPAPPDPTPR